MKGVIINGLQLFQVISILETVKKANKDFYDQTADAGGKNDVFAVQCGPEFDIGQAGSVVQDEKYEVTVTANPVRNHCDPNKVYAKLAELL